MESVFHQGLRTEMISVQRLNKQQKMRHNNYPMYVRPTLFGAYHTLLLTGTPNIWTHFGITQRARKPAKLAPKKFLRRCGRSGAMAGCKFVQVDHLSWRCTVKPTNRRNTFRVAFGCQHLLICGTWRLSHTSQSAGFQFHGVWFVARGCSGRRLNFNLEVIHSLLCHFVL